MSGQVVYENVGFSYGSEKVVLRNISLHALPGEMIALVGPTGAGKYTLVNLLPVFYEATTGRILIDGQDISGVSLASLREQISVVSQEAFLFNGTVRENILYGKLDATAEELLAASHAANCHEFITHLPKGYDSRVGERGVKLSVGEKQRVSIARALLKNAPILILDEATASVDTATERLIQEALERLMANRTSFVIAHRLSHHSKRGPNSRAAPGPDCRTRHARGIAGTERPLRQARPNSEHHVHRGRFREIVGFVSCVACYCASRRFREQTGGPEPRTQAGKAWMRLLNLVDASGEPMRLISVRG